MAPTPMQYCTACQQAIATVLVHDLRDGVLAGTQQLCGACAEQLGLGQPKVHKFSTEMTELIENLMEAKSLRGRGSRPDACPGCGLSLLDFRQKGRLGCPRCYDTFRAELMPLLQRIHEAQTHRGRLPAIIAVEPPGRDERALGDLRRRLEDAVRGERFEEAARLRDELRRAERGEES